MDRHAPPHSKASARGSVRRGSSGDDAPLRPFTSMGNAALNLDSTQASAPPSGRAASREFDVRQFLLDQKGDQPFHKSSLFRAPALLQGVATSNNNVSSSTARLAYPASMSPPGSAFREPKPRKTLLPRMEMTQSAGSLPRPSSTVVFPATCTHRQRQQPEHNSPEDDDGGAISHFYTLERMAESCYHAVQNRNKTWLFLPGSEERSKGNAGSGGLTGIERPARRADLLDLQHCYDAALQFVSKKHDRDVECSDRLAMVDRDFVAIQTRVADKYATRAADDNVDVVAADRKALARLFFEQKWADVVLGELEAMLTVSFLEQGVALRKARIQYAQAFFQLEKLYAAQWEKLNEALDDLERLRVDIRRTDDIHERNARELKEKYETEIQRLTVVFEASKTDMEKKVVESKDQMTKMGDTMKTLNAIFRQMREDTEKVKAVELRENYAKLEQKYDQCCEEVARLRPLVDQNQQLSAQIEALTLEREKFKDDMAQLDVLLNAKDETIATLMEQQSDLLAAQELREAKEEEMRKRAAEEEEDEEDSQEEKTDDEDAQDAQFVVVANDGGQRSASSTGTARAKRTRRQRSSAVCVRCKQDLRVMSAKGGMTENSTRTLTVASVDANGGDLSVDESSSSSNQLQIKRKRIQCLYFRILLPNLRGRRPQREPAWTFSCMRAILFAKQIDDTMCRRSGGAFPSRIRMPEFVYAWFSPWRPIKDEKLEAEYGVAPDESPTLKSTGDESEPGEGDAENAGEGQLVRSFLSAEQRQMLADEERWCLYYGVKALVQQGYLEAKLFLSLLDEKFGEDELVFMLYCCQLLDVLVGGKLNWGPLRDKVAYHSFSREFDQLFGSPSSPTSSSPASSSVKTPPVVPKTIWISPYHASLATSIVLARATESEREALDKKMMEYVVTNVPDEERPVVFLTPEQMGINTGPFTKKKARRRHFAQKNTATSASNDAGNDSDEDSEPPQFIDAHLWVELMMLEYKEEQAHRRAAIRLMFQTAMSSVTNGDMSSLTSAVGAGINAGATMDMEQFRVMVRTLNDETPAFVTATLFRNAYTKGNGVVTFDAFMDAAEASQFFSTCMRLESPASCLARLASGLQTSLTPASSPMLTAVSTSSRAAFLVEKLFTILRRELTMMVGALPLWTRSVTDALVYEISSMLMGSDDGGGSAAYSDGMKLLSSFHRLVEYLQLAKLVKREVTGEAVSSKHIFGIEKALKALVDSVRLRDKSTVELLMDTVKQKLCVKRVQIAFRRHLQREFGAPLAMRTLMHRDYGRILCAPPSFVTPSSGSMPSYRTRNAVRPLPWLLAVISKVFRASLKSHRVPTLLVELSSVSSVITSSSAQHMLDSPSSALASINGGIGPAPRPVLLELVYDFFIDKFGTRWEAEKLIHDVFVTCRETISGNIWDGTSDAIGHPLAWLFGYVCCMDALPPLPGSDKREEGDNKNEDRLLGQNEAVAFIQAILRCGLHRFALLDPNFEVVRAKPPAEVYSGSIHHEHEYTHGTESSGLDDHTTSTSSWKRADESWKWPNDWMPVETAEKILSIAFVKRSVDQTQGMRARLLAEAATAHASGNVVDAGAFLVLALHEWRRYVLSRMNEVREICRALDGDELTQFERVLPLETIASVLQKAGVVFSGDELGSVFRRLLATEAPPSASAAAGQNRNGRPSSSAPSSTPSLTAIKERLSERVAAASFPLLAREPLAGLVELEDGASEPFKVNPNARLSLDLLVRSWRAYEKPSRELMDKLRHVGKSNDIRAETFSRTGVSASSQQRHVLYLSSSTSGNLSSQDVAQLEAVHALFLVRLAAAARVVIDAERDKNQNGGSGSGESATDPADTTDGASGTGSLSRLGAVRLRRTNTVAVNKHDGSLRLLDDEEARENVVNEAWKGFRQLLVGLAKLRARAGIGTGALPDALDGGDGSTDGMTISV